MEGMKNKMDGPVLCSVPCPWGADVKLEAGILFCRNPDDLGCLAVRRDLWR